MELKYLSHIKRIQIKASVAIVLTLSLFIGSALTVSAFSNTYTIIDSDYSVCIVTVDTKAETVLEKAGFNLDSLDTFTLDDSDKDNIKIIINRAFTVEISVDGETKNLSSTGETVKSLLERNNIVLGENDIINVSLEDDVFNDMKITVDRVEFKETKENVEIDFSTTKQKTNQLKKNETQIKTKGQNGIKEVTKVEKYINGNLADTKVINECVIKPCVTQVELVGTKSNVVNTSATPASNKFKTTESGTFVDSNGNTVKYSKAITGQCTAYTAPKGSRGSTGRIVSFGHIAVDPKVIPYGSKVYICSPDNKVIYGYAIASDTGGAMRSGRVLADLFYETEVQCRSFGRRNMIIYIL